ncbi:MAG: type II toxin-antitoxin system PemK/MazF family toxin [Methylocella sp.]
MIPSRPSANGKATRTGKPMPSFKQGDVIRVPFPYTDRSTRQHRPALVVSKGAIGDGESLLWVAMITSAENRAWPGDVPFGNFYAQSGLPAPSVVRPCKLATIEVRHAERLGHIKPALMREVAEVLQRYLGL